MRTVEMTAIPTTASSRSVVYLKDGDPDPARTVATKIVKHRYGKTGRVISVQKWDQCDLGLVYKVEIGDRPEDTYVAYDRFFVVIPHDYYRDDNKKGGAK